MLLFRGLGEWCCLWLCGLQCVSDACVKELPVKQTANLADANASEEEKINVRRHVRAMNMIQSSKC